ncbi:hypothetical protein KB2_gp016 [Klebsiella phage vB_KleM_KB2]|uniref:Uncharacterized protein n=1 Tax=Klebsiella phage vB_KleM_KB2 TaxID=2759197 RepID=A0AAE7J0X8_9CAUD|nr:hypothetical protein KB2_gp016 [Klebsiella phage vB_KleM_KB2]
MIAVVRDAGVQVQDPVTAFVFVAVRRVTSFVRDVAIAIDYFPGKIRATSGTSIITVFSVQCRHYDLFTPFGIFPVHFTSFRNCDTDVNFFNRLTIFTDNRLLCDIIGAYVLLQRVTVNQASNRGNESKLSHLVNPLC